MTIERLGKRNIVLKNNLTDWDLNFHLIIGNRYNYIIDTGLGTLSIAPVLDYLDNKNPIVVINTHYHWDHVWGNSLFRDSTIISHRTCREMIQTNWDQMTQRHSQYMNGEVQICLPNLVFEDSLYFPDDKVRLFYTPGHTIDSISVFDEQDNVLNAGDNIGDTLEDILPSISAGKDLYLQSICKYKALDVNACISGHNAILKRDVFDTIEKKLMD